MPRPNKPKPPLQRPYWPRLLNSEEAASYLGISRSNFLQRVKQHILPPPQRLGQRVLWDIKNLDSYVDALFASVHDAQRREAQAKVAEAEAKAKAENDQFWDDVAKKLGEQSRRRGNRRAPKTKN